MLGKTRNKEQSKLQTSWTKVLLNRTNSHIFEPYVAHSNIHEIFQNIYHLIYFIFYTEASVVFLVQLTPALFHRWDMAIFYVILTSRSSHQRCSVKTGVLRNFAKFTEKHLCQSLFLLPCSLYCRCNQPL